jgi:hypothetical protein
VACSPLGCSPRLPHSNSRTRGLFSTGLMVARSCAGRTCSSAELRSAGVGLTDAPTTSWPRSIHSTCLANKKVALVLERVVDVVVVFS